MKKKGAAPTKVKGIYERIPGSDVWWIRYADHQGRIRREKVGRRSDAVALYRKRKTEALQRKKLPENLRSKAVSFSDLCDDALEHSAAVNSEDSTYELRLKIARIRPAFGHMAADTITKQDVIRWLTSEAKEHGWKDATRNRWQAALSLIFRVGVDNEKISTNPAARIKRKSENNGRIRFLSDEEEKKLRAQIIKPKHLAAFEISIHTGMRMSEQFGLHWRQVDLQNRILTLPRTKNGKMRHIPLNSIALAAFEGLKVKGQGKFSPVFPNAEGDPVNGPRGWFEGAVARAALPEYTWNCNRHTFASRLVMAGVDLRTVGELMGHTTIQMTMRYAHLAPEHKAAAVDRLLAPAAAA